MANPSNDSKENNKEHEGLNNVQGLQCSAIDLKEKPKTKKPMDPLKLTPEYIAQQRALREKRKQEKRAKGHSNDSKETENEKFCFKKREVLLLPTCEFKSEHSGLNLKIMTYNVLAQSLIRRTLFPNSGKALKWHIRSEGLLSEMKYYDADIMCLQELDFQQYSSFWRKEFSSLGYTSVYHKADSKAHGVAIVYRNSIFESKHSSRISFDKERVNGLANSTETNNIALIVCLEFTESIHSTYPELSRNGIIVGTTHLFWHPYGTFERTRQAFILMRKFLEFSHTMNVLKANDKGWYNLFTGDFNSQPYDLPYLSLTAKPVTFKGRALNVLGKSIAYCRHRKSLESHNTEDNEDMESDYDSEGPVPESYILTDEDRKAVSCLEKVHDELPMRAISMYSVGYRFVHPENSGVDNVRNEPLFSNWANSWRGLLDYIFILTKWDRHIDYSHRIDTISEIEHQQNIRLCGLLRLPSLNEMGPEPSGQPRLGQFPSDHICLLAEIELL